jgi:hypothetical protein
MSLQQGQPACLVGTEGTSPQAVAKSEARKSKFEPNSNDQNSNNLNKAISTKKSQELAA